MQTPSAESQHAPGLTRTSSPFPSRIPEIAKKYQNELLAEWILSQTASLSRRSDLINDSDLKQESASFFKLFQTACQSGNLTDASGREWDDVREFLGNLSRSRNIQGFSPSETAGFIFSFRIPLFNRIQKELESNPSQMAEEFRTSGSLVDQLGLYTTEVYQRAKEELIVRQQQDMLELSTPVVQLWDGILALPMIGTLDSNRTQIVMETLLQKIVETGSEMAIIDITGVPTVDTLVAQHLLKTITAARLMGAECIISGIRPQIAATIVHLGVDLGNVVTRATLRDAFVAALKKLGNKTGKLDIQR